MVQVPALKNEGTSRSELASGLLGERVTLERHFFDQPPEILGQRVVLERHFFGQPPEMAQDLPALIFEGTSRSELDPGPTGGPGAPFFRPASGDPGPTGDPGAPFFRPASGDCPGPPCPHF